VTDDLDQNPVVTSTHPSGTVVDTGGMHQVEVTATDASGNSVGAMCVIEIIDFTPPVLTVSPDVTAEQTELGGARPDIGQATAVDDFDPNPTVTNDAPVLFPLGTTDVTWTAEDRLGNVSTATQTVTIEDTTSPQIAAPSDVRAEQTSRPGTPADLVNLGAPVVGDICDAAPTVTNNAPDTFPLGETVVVWTATDESGNEATAQQKVTIEDTTSPEITAPSDIRAEQTSRAGTPVDLGTPVVSDICDAAPTVTNNAPDVFPLGETDVIWKAVDDSGNTATATQKVTIVDTTPPAISGERADPGKLWPVNHKMVVVTVHATLTDICDAAPTYRITSVTCDEPVNGPGDGNTEPDWQITSDHAVKLRAERSGREQGRVYTVTIEAVDASGNTSSAGVTVTVPHDMGKKGKAAE